MTKTDLVRLKETPMNENALEISQEKNEIFESVSQKSNDILKKAKELALKIIDNDGFQEASSFRKMINTWKKQAVESLEDIRKPAYEAYQAILRKRDEVTGPFDEAIRILDRPLGDWFDAQERIRKEKEEQIQTELKRQQDEAKLNAAIAAERAGDHGKVEAILNKPMAIPTVQLSKTQASQGVAFTKIYRINEESLDIKKLITAVVMQAIPVEAIMPNLKFLNAQARILKENMNYPGVEVMVETNVLSRSK